MPKDEYSQDDIDVALSVLDVYRGDFVKAARFVDVPLDLLRRWKATADRAGQAPKDPLRAIARPYPPDELLDETDTRPRFAPAEDVWAWMQRTFIADGAILENEDHVHLNAASIGVLWTNVTQKRHGKRIAGNCAIPTVQGDTWTRSRNEYQLQEWFGRDLDFLITLDVWYAVDCGDASFCALCEHELYHAGQKLDAFGAPAFGKFSGLPLFTLKGHDFEGFHGISRRYGVGNAEGGVKELAEIARHPALIADADVAAACGTCLR